MSVASFGWLSGEVEAFPSRFRTKEDIVKLFEKVSLTLTKYSDLFSVEPCSIIERILMGDTIPFNSFEIDVLNMLNVALTQLHPNDWVAMQGFKTSKVDSLRFGLRPMVIQNFSTRTGDLAFHCIGGCFSRSPSRDLESGYLVFSCLIYGCYHLLVFDFRALRANKKKVFENIPANQEVATPSILSTTALKAILPVGDGASHNPKRKNPPSCVDLPSSKKALSSLSTSPEDVPLLINLKSQLLIVALESKNTELEKNQGDVNLRGTPSTKVSKELKARRRILSLGIVRNPITNRNNCFRSIGRQDGQCGHFLIDKNVL
ncbi:hypothetical protein CR513_37433, partial [Mucuna pruriens]